MHNPRDSDYPITWTNKNKKSAVEEKVYIITHLVSKTTVESWTRFSSLIKESVSNEIQASTLPILADSSQDAHITDASPLQARGRWRHLIQRKRIILNRLHVRLEAKMLPVFSDQIIGVWKAE